MKEILKALLVEFRERDLPKLHPRSLEIPEFPPEIRKAHVLMGMRRTGKTWILFQQMHRLLEQGLDKKKILYLNFEDDRLENFRSSHFQFILDAYFDLYPEYAKADDLAFFFDEIHEIEGWEKFIRRLIDQEKMKIYVTGSSAHMLSKEISTTLRGRGWSQEVFPCSFAESLSFKEIEIPEHISSKKASQMRHLAEEYLTFGGFPESLFLAKELHSPLLQNYMNAVIFKDIVDRHRLSNPYMVKRFLLHCLRQSASLLSVSKAFNTFKSFGESVGKNSLYEYLTYYEDAYALFPVPIFNFSETIRQGNPKKIYAVDPGLVTAYSVKPGFEKGACLETAVFNSLRRGSKEIFYYRTAQQKEVDFVVMSPKGDLALFQACLSLSEVNTRRREIDALIEAAIELDLKEGTIITLDEEETVIQKEIQIHIQPFWKWALLGKGV
jgi:uncharacterized protein